MVGNILPNVRQVNGGEHESLKWTSGKCTGSPYARFACVSWYRRHRKRKETPFCLVVSTAILCPSLGCIKNFAMFRFRFRGVWVQHFPPTESRAWLPLGLTVMLDDQSSRWHQVLNPSVIVEADR
eukprot:Gregarina_sp_Poly_1__6204@NODE_328_length_9480_cov_62_396048_g50_i1_p6_GENE_NODE_328_length_9480_cov_62_396048_g50_i1NODE_328_length_9480_cov_62_396048_g50_i1_p6_ORF_typecomplete_len125_score4_35_NODE_328_length_9480_cov_62_396048_g50_i148335207